MKQIFTNQSLVKPNLLQNIFGIKRRGNALIEVNNLLAKNFPESLVANDLEKIRLRYKISNKRFFGGMLIEFYQKSLTYFLEKKEITEEEWVLLNDLQRTFQLPPSQAEKLFNKLAGEIYQVHFSELIYDGRLGLEREEELELLKKNLRLPETEAEKISHQVRGACLDRFIYKAIEDERISPEEHYEINAIAESLNIDASFDDRTTKLLEKYRHYWNLENSELDPLDVDISLPKNELCYFRVRVKWYEKRTVTKRVNYGGPSARIKIMKGVYYRAGSMAVQSVSSEEIRLIDSGQIYLTNKRLIFTGGKKNSNIRLNKILDIEPFSNGVEIVKDTGRSPFLEFNSRVDVFCLLLERFIREY